MNIVVVYASIPICIPNKSSKCWIIQLFWQIIWSWLQIIKGFI